MRPSPQDDGPDSQNTALSDFTGSLLNELLQQCDQLPRDPDKAREFISRIPKTELHVHCEAAVSVETYLKLNSKYSIDPTLSDQASFDKMLQIDSLSAMIKNFIYLQSFFQEDDDFLLMVNDVGDYAERNNIHYLEAFFAPSMFLKNKLNPNKIFSALDKGFDNLEKTRGVNVRLLLDVTRTFGYHNAIKNLGILLAYRFRARQSRFIGIGLGGSEVAGPAENYIDVFARARSLGFRVVGHAGEEVGPESIWNALNKLKVMRIGHGTSAIEDEKLMLHLAEKRIPLEVCPTSNIITGRYVKRMADHPLRTFFDRGIMVTINSDDPVLFSVELNDEYLNLYRELDFSLGDLVTITNNNLFASFLTEEAKKASWSRTIPALEKALRDVYEVSV